MLKSPLLCNRCILCLSRCMFSALFALFSLPFLLFFNSPSKINGAFGWAGSPSQARLLIVFGSAYPTNVLFITFPRGMCVRLPVFVPATDQRGAFVSSYRDTRCPPSTELCRIKKEKRLCVKTSSPDDFIIKVFSLILHCRS